MNAYKECLNLIYDDEITKLHPKVEFDKLVEKMPNISLDPLVQRIVKEIDRCEFIGNGKFQYPYTGVGTINKICVGSKSLILYYLTDYVINLSKCGDNCADLFEYITNWRIKNKKIALAQTQHCFKFNRSMFPIYSRYSNKLLNNYMDFLIDYDDWSTKYYGE